MRRGRRLLCTPQTARQLGFSVLVQLRSRARRFLTKLGLGKHRTPSAAGLLRLVARCDGVPNWYMIAIFLLAFSFPLPMPSSLLFLISLFLLFPFLLPVSSESPNCLAVYREGGAPAVFQSPKCHRWTLPSSARFRQSTPGCHMAVNQGRRRYLEDRVGCELSLRIPFLSLGQDRGASYSCF